ncbi:MAG: 50S ribosomal protein L25/general stress protein Ctc [Bacteroidales bacterium]|nr:50S ribosomal protein L25/general stress protein Ctc [Bacteroidales bacterium]
MKTVSMSGAPRAHVGKKDARRIRNEGHIPCVMYGGKEQIRFSLDEKAFSRLIFTPDVYLIDLEIAGKNHKAIIQEVQYHPVTDNVVHVDFLELTGDRPIKIAIPVHIEGVAKGSLKGGKMHKKMRKITVKGMLEHIPDHLTVHVDDLDIGQSARIRDLKYEHLEFLEKPDSVIVSIKTARGAAATAAEEEAAEAAAKAETAKEEGKEAEE